MAGLRDRIAALPDRPAAGGVGLAVVALVTLWLGPWCLVAALVLLLARPVRRALRTTLTRRVILGLVAGALVLAGLAYVVPDGLLPVPTGPGVLVSGPGYLGSAAAPRPIAGGPGAATGATADPGPLGAGVEVRTGWYGASGCHDLATDGPADLLAICGHRLVVVDPDTLASRASADLPSGPCSPRIGVDAAGQVLVSGPDRAVRTFTVKARKVATLDLRAALPAGDCVVAARSDATGRSWFTSHRGRVGTVAPGSGRVRVARLASDERIDAPFTLDATGAAYVVGDRALHRFTVVAGRPREDWATDYDHAGGGSDTAPALLIDGRVAIVDGAEPRPRLATYGVRSGRRSCAVPAYRGDPGEATLSSAGEAVVVGRGRDHRWWGRAGGSLARIDVDRCRVRWSRAVGLAGSATRVSLATGLLYAITKQPHRSGVDSWYLTGVDVRSGIVQFSRRLGTGPFLDPGDGALVLAPSGAAYVGVHGGLVRVRDQPVG